MDEREELKKAVKELKKAVKELKKIELLVVGIKKALIKATYLLAIITVILGLTFFFELEYGFNTY